MIAYNKNWLANFRLQKTLKTDLHSGLIRDDEFKAIAAKYPVGFYTPGVGARIGLFILTCVVAAFGSGLIALMGMSFNWILSAGFPIFLGLLSYAALELMVNTKNHYRSGVDDALLFISACLFSGAFVLLFADHNGTNNGLANALSIFLLSLVLTIRFADMLMSAACCCSFFAVIFFGWPNGISSGLLSAPFVMILISAGAYGLIYTNRKTFINYENCFAIGQLVCLLVLYAAGNYYVVQSLSFEMSGQPGGPLPLGAFFWIWTIGLPFVYTGFGVRRKDGLLLRTGLLLIAVAALTYRTYYHLLPLDVTLTLAGAIILGIAYAIMRYLKTPKHGFTYTQPDEEHAMDRLKVESLIVAETFSTPAPAPAAGKFGGGDFGGGGSADSF